MSSTVPSPTLGPLGFEAPSEDTILQAVLADINTAFGGELSTELSTPQGQLASTITALIAEKNDLFLQYVNAVDPLYSSGRMQDAIGRIYFMDRIPARATSVSCVCSGQPGTSIPVNAQAKDSSGYIYICTSGGTIGAGGTTTLTFSNTTTGPIPCDAGTLTTIYSAVPGWDSITNPSDGVLGEVVESQQAFEWRRQNSVAVNAVGSVPSIYAAVFASGLTLDPPSTPTDVYVTENTSSAIKSIGGVNLAPHSIYVAVVGGDSDSIAQAIWQKKSNGCDYNGNTTVEVEDTSYAEPYPTYEVTYQVPTNVPIYFAVSVVGSSTLPSDVVTTIRDAIVSAFAGGDGGSRARIGATLYASRFYAPIISAVPSVQIASMYIGKAAYPTGNSVSLDIDEYPTISSTNISVVIL